MAIKLVAMDLDGTLTQHKSPLEPQTRETLVALAQKCHLVMLGAGGCRRIYDQMGGFPIDIVGYYGMQGSTVESGQFVLTFDHCAPVDKLSITARVDALRQELRLTQYTGDTVELHPSGIITFPVLGTRADPADKLAFDPDRVRRRRWLDRVREVFPEYTVFIGGSSSFDMAPPPFEKHYALMEYAKKLGVAADEIVYFGDDYGPGGNDEHVYRSDVRFVCIDDYRDFPGRAQILLEGIML